MKFLQRHLRAASEHFKIILLLGARQVGKSTLLKHLFPEMKMIVPGLIIHAGDETYPITEDTLALSWKAL